MKIDKVLTFKEREELRLWFEMNHDKETYCWVIVSIKEKPETLLYLDVVEEAICFGWIDGIKKKTEIGLCQRLSVRTKKSNWTQLNKERAHRLVEMNLMTEAGFKTLPNLDVNSFVIHEDIQKRLDDENLFTQLQKFPSRYVRIRIDTIQSVYKEKELFNKRLEKFILHTKKGLMYGQWHDSGRLL